MSEELTGFIRDHVATVEPIEKAANLAYWNFTTTGKKEYEEEVTRVQIALRKVYADRARFERFTALTEGRRFDDPVLARQVILLRNAFIGNQMDDETIENLTRREVAIASTFNTFRAELQGKKVTENELNEVLRESDDLGLRHQAWEASKQIGTHVADQLIELVELRNDIAHGIGFENYYQMGLTLQELDQDELFAIFDELDRLASPVYRGYKADLDARLADRFGIPADNLRPWHYGDPFFQEAPMADSTVRKFLTNTFAHQDIEALTRRFYHAIGLDVDDVLARSDLYEREGKQQHAYCIHVDRMGDIRILANIKPNDKWMGTMLHECGHAVYEKYLDPDLPFILREPAHILSDEAIAMLMGRLEADEHWLVTYAGASEAEAHSLANKLGRQLRGKLLIIARWVPVMSHFERALYEDPHQDLNSLWWDLEERFQMVPRPEGRDAPDWAAKIHLGTVPVYYHNYLMGELIASQLRHYIDTHVLGGNEDIGHRFVTDPAVGHYLTQKVFRPGALRHWQEALAFATGERLRPQYFVDQVKG
ncbi:MAG: M2 family metallopeptidase [Anaerolineae bacterium]|jgi:peptidyl-dipeptidase A